MLYKPKFLSPAMTNETKYFEKNDLNQYTFSCICDGNEKVTKGTLTLDGAIANFEIDYSFCWTSMVNGVSRLFGNNYSNMGEANRFILNTNKINDFEYTIDEFKDIVYVSKIFVKGIEIGRGLGMDRFRSGCYYPLNGKCNQNTECTIQLKGFQGIGGEPSAGWTDRWRFDSLAEYYNDSYHSDKNKCVKWNWKIDDSMAVYLKTEDSNNPKITYEQVVDNKEKYGMHIKDNEAYYFKNSDNEFIDLEITFPKNGELTISYSSWYKILQNGITNFAQELYFGGLFLSLTDDDQKKLNFQPAEQNNVLTYSFNQYPIGANGEYNSFDFPVFKNFIENSPFKWNIVLEGENGNTITSALEQTFVTEKTSINWHKTQLMSEKDIYKNNITIDNDKFYSYIEFKGYYPVQYYYYEIYNNDKKKIFESNKIYSQEIEVGYNNLVNNETYTFKLIIFDSANKKHESNVYVIANYKINQTLDIDTTITQIPYNTGVWINAKGFNAKQMENIGNVEIKEIQETGYWNLETESQPAWNENQTGDYKWVKRNYIAEFAKPEQKLIGKDLNINAPGLYWCGRFSGYSTTKPFLTIETDKNRIYKLYFTEEGIGYDFNGHTDIPQYVDTTNMETFSMSDINKNTDWFVIYIGFVENVYAPGILFNVITNDTDKITVPLTNSASVNEATLNFGAYETLKYPNYYFPNIAIGSFPLEKQTIKNIVLQNNDNLVEVSHVFIENFNIENFYPFLPENNEKFKNRLLFNYLNTLNKQPYWNYLLADKYYLYNNFTEFKIIIPNKIKNDIVHTNKSVLFNLNFEVDEPYNKDGEIILYQKNPLTIGDPSLNGVMTGITIKRKDVESNELVEVDTINKVQKEYDIIDYGARANRMYEYYIYPNIENTFISPCVSSRFTPEWDKWILFTADEGENKNEMLVDQIFLFDLNINSGSMSNNNERTVIKNFTAYPRIQKSPYNYWSGTLKGLLGYIAPNLITYIQTPEQLEAFKNLSVNNKRKFLKDRDGNLFEVEISGPLSIENTDNLCIDLKSKTLPWTEIGKADYISLIVKDEEQVKWILDKSGYGDVLTRRRWFDNERWLDSDLWIEGVK